MTRVRLKLAGTLQGLVGGSGFIANVSYVSLGSIVSQALTFAASLVLTRLYSPTEFGTFSVILAVASVLAIVATLRLETAVPLASGDQEAGQLTRVALASSVVLAVLSVPGLLALRQLASPSTMTTMLTLPVVLLISASVAVTATAAVLTMLYSRQERFSRLARSSIGSSFVQNGVQLALGAAHGGSSGLSLGYVAGKAWFTCWLLRGSDLSPVGGPKKVLALLRRWQRIPLMTSLPSILNTLSVGAIAIFVSALYGAAFAGLFALAVRILALPSALLGQAVRTVFYPKVARLDRLGEPLSAVTRTMTSALVIAALPTFGSIFLLGPEIFAAVFGEGWRTAGVISAILAPWLAVSFVASPLSGLMTVKDQLGRLLALSFVETVIRLGSMVAGELVGRPMVGVVAYSLAGTLIGVCYVAWSLRLVGTSLASWSRSHAWYLAVMACAYSALLVAKSRIAFPVFVALSAALTISAVVYGLNWARAQRSGKPRSTSPRRPVDVGAP